MTRGPFIHNAHASDANTNATFEQFCHSNRALTRTQKTVDGFRGGTSFSCSERYNLVIWNHGPGRVRHGGDHITVFVRKTTEEEKEACVSARDFTEKK